jgi:hypothetical protein
VLIPSLSDDGHVINDYPANLVQLARSETAVPGQNHWIEPELTLASLSPNVHMHRLGAVETVEEEPVRSVNSGDPRHERSVAMISSPFIRAKSG